MRASLWCLIVVGVVGCGGPPTSAPGTLPSNTSTPMVATPIASHHRHAHAGGPDRDGDGIADDVDKCPSDPEDFDGFQDEDGCPDPDNDSDGVLDVDDKCPNVPGPPSNDGCPTNATSDRDGDGIPDDRDKCPDDPEDFDGFQDADGCPDIDNDNDKILDVDDLCPNDPETYNGYQDADGCPDRKP